MYGKIKRCTCFLLAVVILCFCVLPSFSASAKAAASPTAALVAAELIMGAAGISVPTAGAALSASQGFAGYKTDTYDVGDMLNSLASHITTGTSGISKLIVPAGVAGVTVYQTIKKLVGAAQEYFTKDKAEVSVPDVVYSKYGNVKIIRNLLETTSPDRLFALAPYTMDDTITLTINTVVYNYSVVSYDDRQYSILLERGGDVRTTSTLVNRYYDYVDKINYTYSGTKTSDGRFGVFTTSTNPDYLFFYIVFRNIANDGKLYYSYELFTTYTDSNVFFPLNYELLNDVVTTVPYNRYATYNPTKFTTIMDEVDEITVPNPIEIEIDKIFEQVENGQGGPDKNDEQKKVIPYFPNLDWLKNFWQQLGVDPNAIDLVDSTVNPVPSPNPDSGGSSDPDLPYKPDVTKLPDFGNIWDYVSRFVADTLIWMKLWYSGFVLMPIEIQRALWALLVITIIIGLLGVFLR